MASVLLCALLAGCSSGPSDDFVEILEPSVLPHEVWGRPDLRYSGRGTRVAVLGDDLIRTAEGDLRRALAGYAVKVAAIRGEGFTGGERSTVEPTAGMIEIARTYGEDDPDRAVIALGFNDLRPGRPDHTTVMNSARAVFDQFDGSCTVGVTTLTHPLLPDHRSLRAAAVNELIRKRSDRVVDWNAMVLDQPGLLGADGFTPSQVGAVALTHAIRINVEACV